MNPTYVPPIHNHVRRMYVVLDESPAWEADVLCGEDEQPLRWNGWLACPLFSREVAAKIADYVNESDNADVIEVGHFIWIHDALVEYTWDGRAYGEGTPLYERTVHRPDAAGRYAIGAWGWVWYEAPKDRCYDCGWTGENPASDRCPKCDRPMWWGDDV